jgi:hypothetical protein
MGLSHAMPRDLAGGVMSASDLRLKGQNKYPAACGGIDNH